MKTLVMRFMGLGDVAAILVPAVKLIRKSSPDALVDVLSYGAGVELVRMMEGVHAVLTVTPEQWPDNLLPAMESFRGIAEVILTQGYDRIVNLDTWFMPCFLARLLKDAGCKVEGNHLKDSIADFVAKLNGRQLSQAYFEPDNYLASSFPRIADWNTPWWDIFPDAGSYPEFYLRHCCGLAGEVEISLAAETDQALRVAAAGRKIVALSLSGSKRNKQYSRAGELTALLEKAGYHVWSRFDGSAPMATTLARLKATDLLITVPTSSQWLARLVGCPSLMLSGSLPPAVLGAELNVPRLIDCQYCCQARQCPQGRDFACMDVDPEQVLALARDYLDGRPGRAR